MKKVLVPLAEGCEELEAVAIIDTLRRAQFEVVAAGLKPGPLTASRGVQLVPDTTFDQIDPMQFDAIVLPGGNQGVENLMASHEVLAALRALNSSGRWVCAVCAAPLVLQKAGVIDGRKVTCYPSAGEKLTVTKRLGDRVVVDGHIITSQGPGTSIAFALEIVRRLAGPEIAQQVADGMVA